MDMQRDSSWLYEGARHLAELAKSYHEGLCIIVRTDGTFQIICTGGEDAIQHETAPGE